MKYGQIPFPAVSFCNLNPFRRDKLSSFELLKMMFMEEYYLDYQKEAGNIIYLDLRVLIYTVDSGVKHRLLRKSSTSALLLRIKLRPIKTGINFMCLTIIL